MAFQVRAAIRDDIPRMAVICEKAFANNEVFRHMYPNAVQEEQFAFRRRFFENEWSLPGRTPFVAFDTKSQEVTAFARWYFPYSLTDEEEKAGLGKDNGDEETPPGAIPEFFKDFFTRLFSYRTKYVDHNTTYVLDMLAVDPDHQRKGLGGLLLRHVLERVDKEGKQAYLEATKAGVGLYAKLGWRKIDEMVIDTKPYGGEGVEEEVIMMRDPKA
ncbi:acetyltransferase [Phlyctema vagabunda]|uniref:Acetyltransferase n=1 Tax=Phlyctema vagabunda TaxID=108571 RepID=A0ABR4P5W5_9HELO